MNDVRDHVIDMGGQRFEYKLRRSARRRTLEIAVDPDGHIRVTAPSIASNERVALAIRRRLGWILRQQRAYADLPPPSAPRQWVAGETHKYLGRQYRLKIVRAGRPSARLSGRFFIIAVTRLDDRDQVKRSLDSWYRTHASALLKKRVETLIASTTWLKIYKSPQVLVRNMRLRWGSVTARGSLYFNVDLVKLPLGCIDYVVMHELVHLNVPHHGPAFWRLLSRCMPDWKMWRDRTARQEF